MNPNLQLALLALLSPLVLQPSALLAQGSLTPPGAPAPTMKTLDQIEARTAITNTASLVTISAPGSYYLTHNLTVTTGDAIDITTNDVTLDLNGFTLRSTAASATGTGVQLNSGLRNINIVNGFIESGVTNNGSGTYSGSGFGNGISCSLGTAPVNTRVSGVSVVGCLNYGIYLNYGDSTVVESCTVRTVGSSGIMASSIKSCLAMGCYLAGLFGDQVSDSRGESVASFGVYASATALNCYGSSSGYYGLDATTAQNCYGYSAGGGPGLAATTAQNCYGYSGNSYGLLASTAQSCYGSSGNNVGLYAACANNCWGASTGNGTGLQATRTADNSWGSSASGIGLSAAGANNCYGICSGNVAYGLSASQTANTCYGEGSTGLFAGATAQNCSGLGHNGHGLATALANNCYGTSLTNGVGIQANIAIGCYGQGNNNYGMSAGIANSCQGVGPLIGVAASYKYNMP